MKISPDQETEVDVLVIELCNLVRNMIHSAYTENNFEKALISGRELEAILKEELATYEQSGKLDVDVKS